MTSRRVKKMNTSGIRKVFELAQKIKDPIDLSIGKPDFFVPKIIKEGAKEAVDDNKNEYTPTFGILELRKIIAKKLVIKNKIKTATAKNTIITSAVSGGMTVVLPVLIDPGDEVIIFDPYFIGYKQLVLLFSGIPVIISKKNNFSLDINVLRKAITKKTKVIIINTPENPTGHVWDKKELKQIIEIAQKNNLTIISDEIYEDFIYDRKNRHISIASMYNNVVTVGGFSKS